MPRRRRRRCLPPIGSVAPTVSSKRTRSVESTTRRAMCAACRAGIFTSSKLRTSTSSVGALALKARSRPPSSNKRAREGAPDIDLGPLRPTAPFVVADLVVAIAERDAFTQPHARRNPPETQRRTGRRARRCGVGADALGRIEADVERLRCLRQRAARVEGKGQEEDEHAVHPGGDHGALPWARPFKRASGWRSSSEARMWTAEAASRISFRVSSSSRAAPVALCPTSPRELTDRWVVAIRPASPSTPSSALLTLPTAARSSSSVLAARCGMF